MGSVCGIIAEYNPFHLGHLHHLTQARRETHADYIVVALAGPFTQRGEPALFSPAARAEMALGAGADVVVELPCLYAVRETEYFAKGGVTLLKALGCTHLAFGAETDHLDALWEVARLLDDPTDAYLQTLKRALAAGCSHAAAQGKALENVLGRNPASPNDALAIGYLRAIAGGQSLTPCLIPRKGGYHDTGMPGQGAFPSATALRGAIARGDWPGIKAMAPSYAYDIIRREISLKRFCPPQALDSALRLILMQATPETLRALPNVSEGLEHRLAALAPLYTSRENLLAALKTKRYTYTRLNRLLCHAQLSLTQALCDAYPQPPYARLLGFQKRAAPLIKQMKNGPLPLMEKAARWNQADPFYRLDMRSYDLWCVGAGLPLGLGYTQSPVVI